MKWSAHLLRLGMLLTFVAAACIEIQPPPSRATPIIVRPGITLTPSPTETEGPTRTPTFTRTPFPPTPIGTLPPGATPPVIQTPPPGVPAQTPPVVPVAPPPVVVQPPPSQEPVVVVPPVNVQPPVVPTLLPTPISPCLGDETMTWVPRWPRPNETIIITVTSAKQRRFVRLAGAASPELIEASVGGLGYVWRWTVSIVRTGSFEYRFLSEGSDACVSGTVEVVEATPTTTPTATWTPLPTATAGPTNTPVPTASPCGGETYNINPQPNINQPFQITVNANQNRNPQLSGTALLSNGPISITPNPNGTFTFVFQVGSGISAASTYNYIFSQAGQNCLTIPVTVAGGPTATPTNTNTPGTGTPTNTPTMGSATRTPTP